MRKNLLIAALVMAPAMALTFGSPAARADADGGFLDVISTPAAKVAIDGQDTKRTTPVVHLELPAGKHQLTLVSLDGKLTRSLGFTVRTTETTKLRVNLGP